MLGGVDESMKKIIYLHHHPFKPYPMHGLRDAAALGEAVSNRSLNALLFGHNHNGFVWNGRWNIPLVYDAGSSTSLHGLTNPLRVIDEYYL